MNLFLPTWFSVAYTAAALIASVLYGLYAIDIFYQKPPELSGTQRIHQFWFNFVGSVAGWIAGYSLCLKAYHVLWLSRPAHLGLSHAVLFFVAFAGITGHLPRTLFATFQVIDQLMAKALATVTKPQATDNPPTSEK
jgi:hypothetical protein